MQAMKLIAKIIMIVSGIVFACTMIPSLIWPDKVPFAVKCVAFGALLLGGGISLVGQFKKWDEVSAKWRKLNQEDRSE